MTIPYDENFYKTRVGPTLVADYVEAKRVVGDDDQWPVWPARVESDVQVAGLSYEASLAKHREEWRVALGLKPPVQVLAPLGVSGQFFTAGGQPMNLIGCTDFRLYERWLREREGAIETVVNQRTAAGFNTARVFYSAKNLFLLDPRAESDFYAQLLPFKSYMNAKGVYVMGVALADAPLLGFDYNFMTAHWQQVAHAVDLASLVNENDQAANRIDVSRFSNQFGAICSRGSNGGAFNVPPRPWWGWEELHNNGQPEWWRKAHNAMELSTGATGDANNAPIDASHVPGLVTETWRYFDQEQNIGRAGDDGGIGALLCGGGVHHNQTGRQSDLWTPDEERAAREYARRARGVPPEFHDGRYDRIVDDTVLRRYRRTLPDGRYWEETARRVEAA